MPDDSVRIELAFEGGQIIAVLVSPESADAAEKAVAGSSAETLRLDTEDGRITVVVPRVAYVRRYDRETRPGFGTG